MRLLRKKPRRADRHGDSIIAALVPNQAAPDGAAIILAARRLNRAAGTIAGSVLFDSAMEHARGEFHNRAMWTPIVVSALSIAASAHGHGDRDHGAHRARDAIYASAFVTGAVGTAFHLYNVTKRVGGFSWQNLFYAAPLGAPAAISLSGLMGFLSERVRANRPGTIPSIAGIAAGRVVAGLTGVSLLGTTAEAGLLHFRGAFHNPVMLLPVTMPPVAAALLGNAAIAASGRHRSASRWWLRATALMGIGGVVGHAYGVSRQMGGWRNWRQNLFDGPPLPAPPAFTGLALAGLAALGLLRDHPDD